MPQSLTFADAIERFDRNNLACRIPNAHSHGFSSVSKSRRNVLVSYARAAVARAAGLHPQAPALLAVNILPLVATMPQMAERDAKELGRSKPANEASGVRTFLRAVLGDRIEARTYKRRVKPESFLPEWRPLFAVVSKDKRFAKYAGWLEMLQNAMLMNKVRRPQDMPDYRKAASWVAAFVREKIDKTEIAAEGDVHETIAKRRSDYFTAYRKARELLGAPAELPALEPPPRDCERGVQALPNLDVLLARGAERLRAMGREVPAPLPPVREMDVLPMLDLLAPEFAGATRQYLDWRRTDAARSDSWRGQVVSAASNFVAEMIRMGEDPFPLDYPDLFLLTREVASTTGPSALGLKRAVRRADRAILPLFRVILDEAARRSFEHSPLTLPRDQASAPVPFYTAAIFNDFAAAWGVTERVYGTLLEMESKAPEEWREVVRVSDRIRRHMKEYNDGREVEGFKDNTLVNVNWGQAICVGGMLLWRRCRELRTAWKEAIARYGEKAPATGRARRAYGKALKEYVIWVFLLDDGLRIANYAGARMRVHVLLRTEVVDGETRVVKVKTRFRGYDAEANTKKRRRANGSQNKRRRSINPGVVDLELFTDFVFVSRVDDLVACGALPNRDAYDLATDNFAVFVSDQSKRSSKGYSTARLSKRFGRTLHWLACDVLHHEDEEGEPIPSWKELKRSETLRRKWRALWNAHILRQLIVTFVHAVLSDEKLACLLTNDRPVTMADFYNQFEETMAERLKGPPGIDHPEHFAKVCRRLLRGEMLDWATFDPADPDAAIWVTQQQSLPAPKRRRSRRPSIARQLAPA